MPRYDLYLEHGPMRKKTFVHVPSLMGCIAQGPTTDTALESTPESIREYSRFLAAHGERVDPTPPIATRIVEEITTGVFLGNGAAVIEDDRKPLQRKEIPMLLDRYRWIREETIALLGGIGPRALRRKPAGTRSLEAIALHILGAEGGYVSGGLSLDRELNAIGRAAERRQMDVREALAEAARRVDADVRAATPAQLRAMIPHGQQIGSARRTIRRALEHGWEHYLEIRARSG